MIPILYFHNFSAPARAVLMTAETIGLKLQQKIVNLANREHLTENYLKLNPQHTVPTLDDNGVIIWDSHAINAYLVGKYAKSDSLYPKDLAKRALVDQRLYFDCGTVFPWLRLVSRAAKFKGLTVLAQEHVEGITDAYTHLENFLIDRKWVAGDSITIADFSLIASITTLNEVLPIDSKYENVRNWVKRAEDLPCYHLNAEGIESFKKSVPELLANPNRF